MVLFAAHIASAYASEAVHVILCGWHFVGLYTEGGPSCSGVSG